MTPTETLDYEDLVPADVKGEQPATAVLEADDDLPRWRDALADLEAELREQFTQRKAELEHTRAECLADRANGRARWAEANAGYLTWRGGASHFHRKVVSRLQQIKRRIADGNRERHSAPGLPVIDLSLYEAAVSDYELLRDAVVDAFNPPDDDSDEVTVCTEAVRQARDALELRGCRCVQQRDDPRDACARCRALGRVNDKPIQR